MNNQKKSSKSSKIQRPSSCKNCFSRSRESDVTINTYSWLTFHLSLSSSFSITCVFDKRRWWFPTTNEQYRVRGTIVFVGNGQFPLDDDAALKEARCNQWIRLTDAARDSFLCRDVVPGAAYNESCSTSSKSGPFVDENQKSNAVAPPGGKDSSTGDIVLPPPDNFLLMLLLPKHVDYLKLGEVNYRQVDERNEVDGMWSSQRVNP
jgi:hypothetical protein